MNNLNNSKSTTNEFFERPFEEVEGGYYDGKGFYCTPEGSFWDENGVYFNRDGLDIHGGFYDEYCIYNPGPGWNEEFGCYEDEINTKIDEDIKDVIINNNYEELVEGFHYYEKFYKNYDKDSIDDLDNDSINKDEAELINEFIQKNFKNVQIDENFNGNIHNHHNNIENTNSSITNNFENNIQNSGKKNVSNLSPGHGFNLLDGDSQY